MAKKVESTFLSMVLTLLLVTLIASAALAYVYKVTKKPIEQSLLKKKLDAISQVVPGFTNDPNADMYKVMAFDNTDSLEIYPAKKDGKLIGYAVKTFTNKGFGGLVELMVGFSPDLTIQNIAVLSHTETPGLGTKMTTPKFKDQFKEKNPKDFKLVVKKDGGDVDAITAATISSRAFCDAVDRAYKTLLKEDK
ncbi:MAG: RnfABCDGE type electron transport complex subunit G [Bacteroidales bacterium]|nr:RnfABCDGE type electron transport complex subunit G [Bacteroidales bacterium]